MAAQRWKHSGCGRECWGFGDGRVGKAVGRVSGIGAERAAEWGGSELQE